MLLAAMKHFNLDIQSDPEKFIYTTYAMGSFDGNLAFKILVHYMLYSNCIILYGTTPYHQQMPQRANNIEDLGCFGLTEFYHGSFSKGIETKAYYDYATSSFNLTTEGTKGMKFG